MAEIDIFLKSKKTPRKEQPKKRGVLPDRRSSPAYFRRLLAGIEIFDMGRKWNGSEFADLNFTLPATHSYSSASSVLSMPSLHTLAAHTALRNYIIDYDPADIETMHPQLGTPDEGDYFMFRIADWFNGIVAKDSSTDPKWKPKGWKLDPADYALDNFGLLSPSAADSLYPVDHNNYNFFYRLYLTGSHYKNKITSVYDFSSSAVAYTPKAGDKFFLMPILSQPTASVTYHEVIGTPPTSKTITHYFMADFMCIPRIPFFTPSEDVYLKSPNPWSDGGSDSEIEDSIALMKTVGTNQFSARVYFQPSIGFIWSEPDPAAFPPPYEDIFAGWGNHFPENSEASGSLPAGALIGIIKRGSNLFYVWKA